MNNKKLVIFILLIIALAVFTNSKQGQLFALLNPAQTSFTTVVEGSHFPLTLHDPSSIRYILSTPPQRLISTTLATDHILSDLVPQQRIVGVSRYVDHPSLSNIVDFYDSSIVRAETEIESILSRQPDLVFVASYSNPETVRYLLSTGIAVLRLSEYTRW